jgi:hypothetical protein
MPIATVQSPVAVRVQPLADGLSPVLSPKQICCTKNGEIEVWHFCAPDGSRFALLGNDVTVSRAGLVTITAPDWAFMRADRRRARCLRNVWSITCGKWVHPT